MIQIGNLIPDREGKFHNSHRGRVYSIEGIAPCMHTCGGGNLEPKILLEMEEKEIIPYNTPEDGVAPTITTMYARLGTNNLTPGEYGGAMGIMEISKDTMEEKGIKGVSVHPLSHKLEFDGNVNEEVSPCLRATDYKAPHCVWEEEPKSCASRKRGDEHKIEIREDELSNCVTSIDTDSMVAEPNPMSDRGQLLIEPQVLTPLRTEEGRKLRKQGIEKFSNRALYPREDGVSNTITSVQKDNLLQEPSTRCLNYFDENGKQRSLQDRIYDSSGQSTAITTSFHPNIAENIEGTEYRGRFVKEGDAVDTSRTTPTFGVHVMDGVSPALRSERPDANAVCVKDGGTDYKGKFIKEGDGLYTDTTEEFFRGGLDGVSRTLKAEKHDATTCVKEGVRYRIRKLTPVEVGRLMNVTDEDIQKMIDAGISKTNLYKLFGNSIVVSVLYHIFRKMLIETECEEQQLSLF